MGPSEPHRVDAFNANHQFEVKDDAVHHRCSSAFHVPTEHGLKAFLMTYVDVIVRNEGRWRFKERVNKFWDSGTRLPLSAYRPTQERQIFGRTCAQKRATNVSRNRRRATARGCRI